jgi:hypothetical protein
VREIVQQLHQAFIREENELSDINMHDFFAGVLLAPSVSLAQVDGATSLFEELSLNKKARTFSKGGFFLKHDPVVKMIILLQSRYQRWESQFFQALKGVLQAVVPEVAAPKTDVTEDHYPFRIVMNTSYILIRLLETFFLPEGEEITGTRRVTRIEYGRIEQIGEQLQLSGIGSFRKFINTFEVK